MANNMHDLLERFLRKLDAELSKFKLELEADNPGVTETIEKKVLDAEEQQNKTKLEKRKRSRCAIPEVDASQDERSYNGDGLTIERAATASGDLLAAAKGDHHSGRTGTGGGAGQPEKKIRKESSVADFIFMHSKKQGLFPSKVENGPDNNESDNDDSVDFSVSPSTSTFVSAFERASGSRPKKSALNSRVGEILRDAKEQSQRLNNGGDPLSGFGRLITAARPPGPDPEDAADPDEPRYCICNQVSYGEMVACDNKGCPFEWLHYACVGITQPPKGKWYCPQCTAAMRRRASRLATASQQGL